MVLAQWIVDQAPPMDLWDINMTRMLPHQNGSNYLRDRTTESLGLLYENHWPFRQYKTARNVRKSALHDRLAAIDVVNPEDELMIITNRGIMIRQAVDAISLQSRNATGVRVQKLDDDDAISAVALVPPADEEADEEE